MKKLLKNAENLSIDLIVAFDDAQEIRKHSSDVYHEIDKINKALKNLSIIADKISSLS